jgi:chromosome segregation ATPase
MEPAVIATSIAAVVAGLFGYGGAKFARRKEKADAASIVTATALSLIAPLNADISKLSGRVSTLENENHRLLARVAGLEADNRNLRGENSGLRARVTSLESQILALGHTPVNGSAATVTTSTTETKTVTQEEQS